MTMTTQILLGTLYLSISTLFHVALLAVCLPQYKRIAQASERFRPVARNVVLISFGLGLIVVAHTVQIWFWAALYDRVGAFPDFPSSFYFATVTYTTLGYGDLVLGPGLRIFATFGAITGMLSFGISTAFLIGILSRLLQFLNPGPDK